MPERERNVDEKKKWKEKKGRREREGIKGRKKSISEAKEGMRMK